jgi:SacI homology domain
MWNYNLYKQLRIQHIPSYWMIPLIQGYVGHAKPTLDIDLILISRRRWLLGGTRYNSRGIDDDGNTANFVESEQIIVKNKINREKNQKRTHVYSFS